MQVLALSLTTVKQRPARIEVAGARHRGQSVLCTYGGDLPMLWAWRDASPAPIVILFTMVWPARSLNQRKPSSRNRVAFAFRGAVVSVGTL